MTWSYTRSWWHIVHEVVAEVEERNDGLLPWRPSYAEVFPTPASLLAALGYFWTLQVEAQVDERPDRGSSGQELTLQQFCDAHAGLRTVLTNRSAGVVADRATQADPVPGHAVQPA